MTKRGPGRSVFVHDHYVPGVHSGIDLMYDILAMSKVDGPESVGTAALWEIWTSNYPIGYLRNDDSCQG